MTGVLATTIVDTSALLKVVVASLVAGIGVTAAFSLAIMGATRFTEMRRDGRAVEAAAFAGVALVALAASAAAVVFGLIVMTSK
jgi:hypothetical protein